MSKTPDSIPLIELRKVSRSWGDRKVLEDFSLVIPAGQKVALLGPSGGGKSTLLRIIAGIIKPSSGAVLADGVDLATLSASEIRHHRSRFGIIQQTPMLISELSVHQNVLAGLLVKAPWYFPLAALLFKVEAGRVRKMLNAVDLGDFQWESPTTLSGGQQQRVAIARAMISTPSAILADEPTASLDPVTANEVARLLLNQSETRKVTLIFCTHWAKLVLKHVDRAIGIRDGRILFDSVPGHLPQDALDQLYRIKNEEPCELLE